MLSSTPVSIAVLILTMSAVTKNSPQQKEYACELNWITKFENLIGACEKGEKPGSILVQEMIKF